MNPSLLWKSKWYFEKRDLLIWNKEKILRLDILNFFGVEVVCKSKCIKQNIFNNFKYIFKKVYKKG